MVHSLRPFYLVFAEGHHALIGRIGSGEDVGGVVGPFHTVVQFRKLRGRRISVVTEEFSPTICRAEREQPRAL